MSDSDSDIDDLLLGTLGKSSKRDNASRRRERAESESEDNNAGGNDADQGFVNPYPLEGKYKDKADRTRIESMPEIERETLLYDRDKEVADLRERDMLQTRLKQQKAQQQAALEKSKASRRPDRDLAQPKLTAMQELKRKREAKKNAPNDDTPKRRRHDFSSSEDESASEEGTASEDEFDTPASRRLAERRQREETEDLDGNKPITFEDALQIRLSRKSIMKFLYYPSFPETVKGCFVRISIGVGPSGKSTYRLCQVQDTLPAHRPYKLPNGDLCKRALSCAHGSSIRTFEGTFISDSPFTEQEYDDWARTMGKDQLKIMNKRRLRSKLQELKTMGEHRLTDAEINGMIEEKRKLSKIPPNVAVEKMRISGLIAEARELSDVQRVEELTNELAKIAELTANRGRNGDLDKMSKLNERNRLSTMRTVGKAEITNADKRRQAELTGKSDGDPFSRLKTKPKTFYESTPSSPMPGSPVLAAANGHSLSVLTSPTAPVQKKAGGVDGLIGGIDLDLDL